MIVKAKAFKEWVRELLTGMQISNTLIGVILEVDIPNMVKRAEQEISPLYPVPIYLDTQVLIQLYRTLGGFKHGNI
jgi:hypothetical protein